MHLGQDLLGGKVDHARIVGVGSRRRHQSGAVPQQRNRGRRATAQVSGGEVTDRIETGGHSPAVGLRDEDVALGIYRYAEGAVALTVPGQPGRSGGGAERVARAQTAVGDHREQFTAADSDLRRACADVRHQAAAGDRGSARIAGDETQLDSGNLPAALVEDLGRELPGHSESHDQCVGGDVERVCGSRRGGQLIGTAARRSESERDCE